MLEPWELFVTSANPMSLPSIRDLLDRLSAAVKSFSLVSLEKQMAAAQTLLCENPPIDVAVPGQFKAGKSSFLNSLIGHDVLPVGAIPVTTAITRLAGVDWKIDVVEPDHPDIPFTKSFDAYLDLLWFLIPMFLFRRIFERPFIKRLPKEVKINLSRLAYQWEKSVNNAIDAMRVQATGYIHQELATIEALLSRMQGQTDDIKRIIAQIEKLSGTLSE
jgi:hypothetical protein